MQFGASVSQQDAVSGRAGEATEGSGSDRRQGDAEDPSRYVSFQVN